MNLIDTITLEYPRSLWQLRQEHPNVSFPPDPTDEDLAPFNHANVHPTPQPTYAARTERIEDATREPDADGIYRQRWTIRPATTEEITAYDIANAPEPQWMSFGIELAANPAISELYDSIPTALANGLSIGLSEASKGDTRLFIGLWQRVLATGGVSAELLGEIGALAYQFNLPTSFVAQMMPPDNE